MKNDDRKLMRFQRILVVSNGIIITVGFYRVLAINCQAFYILPLLKFFMEFVIASRLPAEQQKKHANGGW